MTTERKQTITYTLAPTGERDFMRYPLYQITRKEGKTTTTVTESYPTIAHHHLVKEIQALNESYGENPQVTIQIRITVSQEEPQKNL